MSWTVVEKKLCAAADPMVTIVMDSTSDASDLPTAGFSAGSVAVVAGSDLPAYMLSASGTWETINGGGGGGGGGVQSMAVHVTATESGFTVDKTWKEIYDALQSGVYVYSVIPENLSFNAGNHFASNYISLFCSTEEEDDIYCADFGNNFFAETDNVNGYPNGALS